MQNGRRKIYSSYKEVTKDNVISILRDAMTTHRINAERCAFLMNYEEGIQTLQRVKTFRPDIDIEDIDNVANEIVEFKLGYNWGNPITLTQRGAVDSGAEFENIAIPLLNECYSANLISDVTQELARNIEITGVGYTFVDIDTDDNTEKFFEIYSLDPKSSFIVYTSDVKHKPLLGVTYSDDKLGNTYYTCFSATERFEIVNLVKIINGDEEKDVNKWTHNERSGEKNPLGIIPIIEWERSKDRMGCFERQIQAMDSLNIQGSDFSNDVDQNTQAVWHCNDVDFPEDENGNVQSPSNGDWLQTYTSKDGKTPFVTPLQINYDYSGMLNNYVTKRSLILQKCNVPQRNDNSGGSTGIAMSDATGWSSAETSACKQQRLIESAKMREVEVVLRAIKRCPNVPSDSPLLTLRAIDMIPSIKRNKTYEMTTKINAFATGIKHGLDYKALIKVIDLFDDPQQVIEDSEETIKKYIDYTFSKQQSSSSSEKPDADKIMQDASDQAENSPMLNK